MKLISKNQYGNSINRIDAIKDSTPKILPSKYKYLGKGNESNNYNTPIPINKVTLYNKWFNSLPSDIRNTDNYDMQGYWLNMVDGRNESRKKENIFQILIKNLIIQHLVMEVNIKTIKLEVG